MRVGGGIIIKGISETKNKVYIERVNCLHSGNQVSTKFSLNLDYPYSEGFCSL